MPPCAQTECERLTGTTENRSTSWPASAIFIAAARPASPPPTTAILIPLAIDSENVRQTLLLTPSPFGRGRDPLQNSRQQTAGPDERNRRVDAHGQEQDTES